MSWPRKKIGEIITFKGGGTPRKDVQEFWADEIPWATVKDFKSLELSSTQDSISRKGLAASAANLIPAGHVIIPTRMALGKAAINSIDLAINQDLRALIPNEPIDSRFLLHAMISLAPQIEQRGEGATVKGITQAKLASLELPIPPLAEQKRIAAVLDAADELRTKRRESLAQLDALLQSTFLDIFGDPVTNPKRWDEKQLSEVVRPGTIVTYGIVQAGDEYPGGVPYIRTGDLVEGEIVVDGLRHTNPAIASKFERSKVDSGDIVMSIRATVGTTAVVPKSLHGANLTQGTARISPGPNALLPFLLHYLRSHSAQRWIQRQIKGATFKEITLSRLRELPVLLPPIGLQKKFGEIVASIEERRSLERRQLDDFDALFASLQSRAFRGEL